MHNRPRPLPACAWRAAEYRMFFRSRPLAGALQSAFRPAFCGAIAASPRRLPAAREARETADSAASTAYYDSASRGGREALKDCAEGADCMDGMTGSHTDDRGTAIPGGPSVAVKNVTGKTGRRISMGNPRDPLALPSLPAIVFVVVIGFPLDGTPGPRPLGLAVQRSRCRRSRC